VVREYFAMPCEVVLLYGGGRMCLGVKQACELTNKAISLNAMSVMMGII
jgi:hypothetical protein